MTSQVYFANIRSRSKSTSKVAKVNKLFEKAGFHNFLDEEDMVALKIHFGEEGNDGFISPVFAREVIGKIKQSTERVFVTDTNTLYSGKRHNAIDHLNIANAHGFTYAVLGAPVIIADGLRSQNYRSVKIDQKHFETVKIATDIVEADAMVVMSHFKAHEQAGFGGAIKNLAMGCAPAQGKKEQHDVEILVNGETCISCGACAEVCPEEAITIETIAEVDQDLCVGCGECTTVCPTKAIHMDWATELADFMERMTEYALGAVKGKQQKVGYINFVMNVTPLCDCAPWSDAPIVPDIGILASTDPVALDQACYDLVNAARGNQNSELKCNHEEGADKFKGVHAHSRGEIQLTYGESIGLGSTTYELVEI